MAFSIAIFVAAVWALSSEMAEDSLVDLIYGHVYGWRTLIRALVTASLLIVAVSAVSIYFALGLLVQYVGFVSRGSAILLGVIGLFWVTSSLNEICKGEKSGELEETERMRPKGMSELRNFLIAFQLVSIEELEIFLIVIPLVVSSHLLEASLAATIGIIASLSAAALLRSSFERLVADKLTYLKVVSGVFLIGLGVVLFLEL